MDDILRTALQNIRGNPFGRKLQVWRNTQQARLQRLANLGGRHHGLVKHKLEGLSRRQMGRNGRGIAHRCGGKRGRDAANT